MHIPTLVKHVQSSDGTLLYAEAVGNPQNPHVVFIHEATLCARVFDELFMDTRLTEHLYIVRYDLRCHGRSGVAKGPEGQHPMLFGCDYVAVTSAFNLRSPILVAWGFGAAVVADICSHVTPFAISGVVYIAPFPYLGQPMRHTVTPRMLGIAQKLGASQDAGSAGRAKTEWLDAMFSGPPRPIPSALKAIWLGGSIAQDPDLTSAFFSSSRPHNYTTLLEAGRRGLPLMLLTGLDDALVDDSAVTRDLRQHFKTMETHVLAQSSHAIFVDRKDEFVRLLLIFVGRLAVMSLMSTGLNTGL